MKERRAPRLRSEYGAPLPLPLHKIELISGAHGTYLMHTT